MSEEYTRLLKRTLAVCPTYDTLDMALASALSPQQYNAVTCTSYDPAKAIEANAHHIVQTVISLKLMSQFEEGLKKLESGEFCSPAPPASSFIAKTGKKPLAQRDAGDEVFKKQVLSLFSYEELETELKQRQTQERKTSR